MLFDLDGTLLDTLQDLTDATNYALCTFGYPQRSKEEIRRFVGNGALRQITLALPEGADVPVEQVLSVYKSYYAAHCADVTAPYPGIEAVLAQLAQDYSLGIVTNKPDAMTQKLCKTWFDGIFALGECPDRARKPAADMVHFAMAQLGVTQCVYVGDSEVDIRTAQNAGLPCIAVTWGFRDVQVLRSVGAVWLCHRVEELPAMIEKVLGEYHGK